MATTARLDLSVWRNDDMYEFPIRIIGPNLTGVSLRAQIRLAPDTPGAPLAGLGNVTNGNAEGIRLASVAQIDGQWVNDVRLRLNKSTRQALPYSGELGDASPLAWAMQIAGRTRLVGCVYVLAHTIDSDGAPSNRPERAGVNGGAGLPSGGATLTIAEDDVAQLVIDGAGFVEAATAQAAESARTAALAAQTALAAGRYFPTRAAGQDETPVGGLFATSDEAGILTYYERTPSGSTQVGQAVTPQSLSIVNVRDYGAVLDGVTDDSQAIAAANAVAGGRPLYFAGICKMTSVVTITAPIFDGIEQIFTLDTIPDIKNGLFVRPEWWGIGNQGALDAAIRAGRVVRLRRRRYKPSGYAYGFDGPGKCIDLDGVQIIGDAMPSLAEDCRSLEGGSIIEGMVLAFANNFTMRNVGIDCGKAVVDSYYGGQEAPGVTEAFNFTYPNDAAKNAGQLRRGVRYENVVALCSSPTAPTHAIILGEGATDVVATGDIIGVFGVHGAVIKCRNIRVESIAAFANASEGLVIKSDDQATAISYDINIDRVLTSAGGPPGTLPYATAIGIQQYSILFHASGNFIDKVQIGQTNLSGAKKGVATLFGGNFTISSVKVGDTIIDQGGVSGTRLGVTLADNGASGGKIQRVEFDRVEARNTTCGFQAIFTSSALRQESVNVGRLTAVNVDQAIDVGNTADLTVEVVRGANVSDAIYRITGTPSIAVGKLKKDANAKDYSSLAGGLVPSLANGWSQISGSSIFNVELAGEARRLRGLVQPGTSNVIAILPPWARPEQPLRLMARGFDGTNPETSVPLTLGSDGALLVNEATGGTANCARWLSLDGVTY